MASISDELIIQFLTFTGTEDTSRAASYLEMSGGSLETAVSLYMEHSNAPPSSTSSNPTGIHPGSGSQQPGIHIPLPDLDGIRPPDEAQTMRLMDFEEHPSTRGSSLLFPPHNSSSQNPFFDARELTNAAAAAAADDEEEKEDAVAAAGLKTLNDMFAPPTHLMHQGGGFQGARNMAKDARRWLLVNLQRDEDFACHALNRDVWRDELVENLVREGFIFWQQMDNTPDGMTYVQRYNVQAFPHVAILDPRTGRLMWRKEGWTQVNPMTSEMFAQIAADFCSHHTFDKPPAVPRQNSSSSSSARPKRPIHELTEEQQLQAAIRASMADNSDDDSVEVMEENDEMSEADEEEKPKSFDGEIREMVVEEEPSKGARVQIRMPDGGRVVRRFNEDDLVKVIYAFVAQTNDDAKSGKTFELRSGFPPKDLITNVNNTIKSCNLSGQSISVRWT